MDKILLFSLCVIPSLILLYYIYIKDRIEKEPPLLLVLLFIGGVIASIISLLIELLLKKYIPFVNLNYNELNTFQIIFKVLFTICLVEEGSKWLINYITIWNNKNFNYIFDSIVYCVYVAVGFATFENIVYAFSNNLSNIVLRGFISVPSHAIFGIFMGYYLGICKNSIVYKKNNKAKKYKLFSFIIPIILHFVYDYLLINNNAISYILFSIFIVVIYIIAFIKIKKISSIKNKL